MSTLRVRATRNFRVGPGASRGGGYLIVKKGQEFEVNPDDVDLDDPNSFFLTLEGGGFFGWNHLDEGWEKVDSDR